VIFVTWDLAVLCHDWWGERECTRVSTISFKNTDPRSALSNLIPLPHLWCCNLFCLNVYDHIEGYGRWNMIRQVTVGGAAANMWLAGLHCSRQQKCYTFLCTCVGRHLITFLPDWNKLFLQWLKLSFSKWPNKVGVFILPPSSENRNKQILKHRVLRLLENRRMDKVQNSSNSECYRPSSWSRKLRLTTVDPPRDTPLSTKVGTKFHRHVAVSQLV
jgi:hypothetical protein